MTLGIFGSGEGGAAELLRILESLSGGRSVIEFFDWRWPISDRIFEPVCDALGLVGSERSYF